jgi:hypothetical protein
MTRATIGEPQVFLAYTPRGVGLCCALMYLKSERDVSGWFTGARDNETVSAYFLLEDFYARSGTRFYASEGSDLYGGWRYDYAARPARRLATPARVEDALCHLLEHAQDAFFAEWLFGRGAPDAAADAHAYAEAELAMSEVNIQYRMLNRLSRHQPTWTYYSHGFEQPVLRFLARHWPLDYRPA